ncbi:MAG: ATP-dependent helicase [Desulfovibrio sp.]|nr:ATP-dependent helicase [Desulfovibrio sp.]
MIEYDKLLNEAQYKAATMAEVPALIVAGAGSGKTRTIVYRLAWLIEHGVLPTEILLLTFTRKAAQEMMHRAGELLPGGVAGLSGGTFHSFAYSVLRQYRPAWLEDRPFTVMDSADQLGVLKECKDALLIGKGDRAFPKTQAVIGLFSKCRNKEMRLEEVLKKEGPHLLAYEQDLQRLMDAYAEYKRDKAVLDYDDLLFELEALLMTEPGVAKSLRRRYRAILVDEYQDTNLVQARLVRILSGIDEGEAGPVMVVGDEAQSIYSFRGATVSNILDFPRLFPGAKVVTLEQNYRSTKPILDVANCVLSHAAEGYRKNLFTERRGGDPVRLKQCISDKSQAEAVAKRIERLLETYPPDEIAVLFRSGYQSYQLEMQLNQRGVKYRKYGGLKYTEAAHVKDVIAYLKLVINPMDYPSFLRLAALFRGIGPKTSQRIYASLGAGDAKTLARLRRKHAELFQELDFLDGIRRRAKSSPSKLVGEVVEQYDPLLKQLYPENYPKRRTDLDEVRSMAAGYGDLDLFLADLMLESPEEDEREQGRVVLSTIHSAKGLEWNAVLLIDLAENRFPTKYSLYRDDLYEEERRLMYVACTRAREVLELYAPASIFDRTSGGSMPAELSPFLQDLDPSLVEQWSEGYGGHFAKRSVLGRGRAPYVGGFVQPSGSRSMVQAGRGEGSQLPAWDEDGRMPERSKPVSEDELQPVAGHAPAGSSATSADEAFDDIAKGLITHCRHRMFGIGKILGVSGSDKIVADFPGYGVKTIVASYLLVEGK